ncbi:MAG TPA: HIT domain-containing protein [Candidatus Saccharimonadales bacterium]|nr:HIT domain-containing protein [Candidatus Saccharimonadales bacterium]
MEDCLFCSIVSGAKDKLVWENDVAAAFNDIHPKAPVHVLVILKKHYDSIDVVDDPNIIGELMTSVKQVAKKIGVAGNYRIIINTGPHAGKIDHLHVHILGGKHLDD